MYYTYNVLYNVLQCTTMYIQCTIHNMLCYAIGLYNTSLVWILPEQDRAAHGLLLLLARLPDRWLATSGVLKYTTRGSGVLPKGQHLWNITVTKEARMDPEVVLDSSAECHFRGIFFCP